MKFGQKNNNNGVKEEVETPKIELIDYNKATVEEEVPVMTHKAYGLVKNLNNISGFYIVCVAFNPVTKKASVYEIAPASDSREEAEYRFRIAVGKHFSEVE